MLEAGILHEDDPLYARAGIPEVWIVNLEAQRIELHRDSGDVYRTRHLAGLGDSVAPERPEAVGEISVRDVLGDLPASDNATAE